MPRQMNRHSDTLASTPGERIRQTREALKMSRVGLAYKAGVDLSTIHRIETGKVRQPHRLTIEAIDRVLEGEGAAA